MFRKLLLLLCVCCVVLCAIVGYLSKQVDQETSKREADPVEFSCADFIEDTPKKTARILVTDFGVGKHLAKIDRNGDDLPDEICVPLFPKKIDLAKYGYKTILVCMNGVESKDQVKELTRSGSLDTDFWPKRQKVDEVFHSQLAQNYRNLDFSKSVVLHYGYSSANPILGEASLKLSMMVGAGAVVIGVLCLLSFLVIRPKKVNAFESILESNNETSNRAGLPIA